MAQTKMKIEDWLDDLCVRFIINLPQEELSSVERICFQVEEAQWFYEDFVRPLDPTLPSMSLRSFCLRIFKHCPLFSAFTQDQHLTAFSEFLAYKTRVPVRGAILLNDAMDQVVLVKGWKKTASWSFPRGKINKDEKDLDCALREADEETGFDVRAAGLVTEHSEESCIESNMREQNIRMYVFRGVPMDTHFEPKTRNEISEIAWHRLSDLPTLKKMKAQAQRDQERDAASNSKKYYMVAPFLAPLKKWIAAQKRSDTPVAVNPAAPTTASEAENRPMARDQEQPCKVGAPPAASITTLPIDKSTSGPEAVKASAASEEMSMELKRLLSIQDRPALAPTPAPAVKVEPMPPSNQEKSMALLALLRNNANGPTGKQEQNVRPLQALPVHPASSSVVPGLNSGISPHHTPNPLQSLNAGPPVVPVPSSHFESANHHNIPSVPQQPSGYPFPSSSTMAPPILQKHPQRPQHMAGGVTRPHFEGHPVHSPVVPKELEAYPRHEHHSIPRQQAPIKTTPPQFNSVHAPAIPTPSQLPPPKLTNHSLQLLNVLKNGQKPKAADQNASQTTINGSVPTTDSDMRPPFPEVRTDSTQTVGPSRNVPSTGQPIASAIPTTKLDRPGNKSVEHRQNLLSLFRTPSATPCELTEGSALDSAFAKPPVVTAPTSAILPPMQPPQASTARGPTNPGINGQAASNPSTSQAHKEFLLGYLDAVANSSRTA